MLNNIMTKTAYFLFLTIFWICSLSVFYFAFSGEHQLMINSLVCTMATSFLISKIKEHKKSLT